VTRPRINGLWAIPAVILAILVIGILALPGFVASATHRATIEHLASSLTGRQVRIDGSLSLALFPAPELIAHRVTITGPDKEIITARALTLDVSLPALLHGQISAKNLMLDSPRIALPWPLPGGAAAIAPPGWLTALHAQIQNGSIALGAANFSKVDADIFTGSNGTVTVSGTGMLRGTPINLSMALGAVALTGIAPLILDASSGNASLHFSGGLNSASLVTGGLSIAAPNISGTATITANAGTISASAIELTDAKAILSGTAALDISAPGITADLDLENFDTAALQPLLPGGLPALPVALTITATNLLALGQTIPALQASLDASPAGITVTTLGATLPGGTSISATASISPAQTITGKASLLSPDLPGLLQSFGHTTPAGWSSAALNATLGGTLSHLALQNLSGKLGKSSVTGSLVLSADRAGGTLKFDQLDLAALLAWLDQQKPAQNFTIDGEVAAGHASLGPLPLNHLLIDASLAATLNIRRISANLYNGLAAGSVALDASGQVTAAHGFISLPSATPLAALLPAGWTLPPALLSPPLNLTVFAQGTPAALSTSLVGALGAFSFTAAPTLNLPAETAAGPLSLRHPNAIAAMKLIDPAASLAWPGAGSISLRADFLAGADTIGLPDFVLSLGDSTLAGRVIRSKNKISGQIDAGTLALPALPPDLRIPWQTLVTAPGKIDVSAARLCYAGTPILQNLTGAVTAAANSFTLALTQADLAGGSIAGQLTATTIATPALTATLTAKNIDAAALALPINFPVALPTGTLTLTAQLTAAGYTPKIWAATLGGSATLTATDGALDGFDLAALKTALATPKARAKNLRGALSSGTSNFTSFALAATLDHGNATLTNARLTGPDGTATATGSIDIYDADLALNLLLEPDVSPALDVGTAILGGWANAKQYPKLNAALGWKPQS
jgi:uncharacterized protein involved in outer membrane biogenesis